MAYTNQTLPTATELSKNRPVRQSEDRQALLPPPPVAVPRAQGAPLYTINPLETDLSIGSARSDPSTNTNSVMLSTRSSQSSGSNRSSVGGWSSGLSLGSVAAAYGDHTGTKGFGTGNELEHADRVNSIPGAYGGSTGTKGFGTGNDYERSSPRGSPASSNNSLRSNRSRRSLQSNHSGRSKVDGPKLGEKLRGTAEVVAGKMTKNKALVERGQERKTITASA
ncbi:hypothetical protein VNI00_011243 [Paramarasmius palmivorus]|uniref:Uncharacterized protein n=1 Tax=Paramarasmius palmivorus TaxID=297713 RepID=A0AAW0CH05_9AGAR